MNDTLERSLSKVPEVTLGFWVIKILATTLGETGGDTVTMTLNWGYLAGTVLFAVVLLGLVVAQITAKRFNPVLYWSTIVASTTFGTTMADFADRSLGIGYTGGSALLLACLAAGLGLLRLRPPGAALPHRDRAAARPGGRGARIERHPAAARPGRTGAHAARARRAAGDRQAHLAGCDRA